MATVYKEGEELIRIKDVTRETDMNKNNKK